MRVAVLGTGRMGTALAKRLLSGGHDVSAWNRSPEKTREVVAAGGRADLTPSAAMEGADVVLTSLSDDLAVREIALSRGGVLEWAGHGAPYMETSTVSPQLTGELAGLFPSFAAVPVLGGPATVLAGDATYLVGTADATFQVIEPLLTAFGGRMRRYGSASLASTAKLAVNLLLLSHAVSLAESFALGRAGGLSDDQLRELIGGLVAPGVKNRFEALLGSAAEGWWTTALGAKDASLAVELARLGGADLQVGEAVRQAYLRVAQEGHANEDIAAVRHLYDAGKKPGPQT